jgi:exopolysaccharide biosynthesis polyprenyl glycosylphosphotransferase
LTLAIDMGALTGSMLAAHARPMLAPLLAFAVSFVLYLGGVYADRSSLETRGVLWFASKLVAPIAMITLAAVALDSIVASDGAHFLLAGVFAFGALVLLRVLTWSVLAVARRRGLGLYRTLIVGDSERARQLCRKLTELPENGLLPVAMLPLGNGHGYARLLPRVPSASQLACAIEESSAEHVVLAPDGSDETILECVKGSDGLNVDFSILPPLADFFLHPTMVTQVGGLPLIPLGKIAKRRRVLPGKRLLDLGLASILLVLLSPLLAAIALAIKFVDGGPVIYRQLRVGRNGKLFEMLKFRSMVVGAERLVVDLRDQNVSDGLLFRVFDDPRITRLGRLIRRLSIDELPQLWNVIRGEMSLVGPRPLAVMPDDFGPVDNKRHNVLPGITGYWQIAGDHSLTYEEMVKLDLAYVENWSLWLDVLLLIRTVPAIIHRRGPS